MSKRRTIKNFDRLDGGLLEQVKLAYPSGFAKHLIRITDVDGRLTSALPFETEDSYYLIRMTKSQATEIIAEDDDYDADGRLIEKVRFQLEDKYDDDDDDASFDESLEGEDYDDDPLADYEEDFEEVAVKNLV